jgi:hypothetical protein
MGPWIRHLCTVGALRQLPLASSLFGRLYYLTLTLKTFWPAVTRLAPIVAEFHSFSQQSHTLTS